MTDPRSYGQPFLVHTYFHHVTRIDHRHNFSPYNILLYLDSAIPSTSAFKIESIAFLPQILLSTVVIPLVLAKKDLATSMMAQTFAFVTFNKVCTSQVRQLPNRITGPKLTAAVLSLVYGIPAVVPP
jgi:phosphatidylinositol glycan class M